MSRTLLILIAMAGMATLIGVRIAHTHMAPETTEAAESKEAITMVTTAPQKEEKQDFLSSIISQSRKLKLDDDETIVNEALEAEMSGTTDASAAAAETETEVEAEVEAEAEVEVEAEAAPAGNTDSDSTN